MIQVYVSSTYEDLKEHREKVCQALAKLVDLKVIAMEDYVARDDRVYDACVKDVQNCQIYIGILAFRYGTVSTDPRAEGRSITECEYRAAVAAKVPRLLFVIDDEAPFKRSFDDRVDPKKVESASKLEALKKVFGDDRLASRFTSPEDLASKVAPAVANELSRMKERVAVSPSPSPSAAPEPREILGGILLLHAGVDLDLAQKVGDRVRLSGRNVTLDGASLFAKAPEEVRRLEAAATGHHAAIVIATPRSRPVLLERSADVLRSLSLLTARTGEIAVLACGLTPAEALPGFGAVTTFSLGASDASILEDSAFGEAMTWARDHTPPAGVRAIGIPITFVAMTAAEAAELKGDPGVIGRRAGMDVQQQFADLTKNLEARGIEWRAPYGTTRLEWSPFGGAGQPLVRIIAELVSGLNDRQIPKLKERRIKAQWYPFERALIEEPALAGICQEVAKCGCVVVVDEISLFHPDLRDLFTQSAFFNSDQIAVLTVAPPRPGQDAVGKLLEQETRQRLRWAFDRFERGLDPQVELGVDDLRRLRRWLSGSLPETATNLREPRPNRDALKGFFDNQGIPERPTTGEYPWGGGFRR